MWGYVFLGQKLTEEKIGGIDNPLPRYDMASRYCIMDKIGDFFNKQLAFSKGQFTPEEIDTQPLSAESRKVGYSAGSAADPRPSLASEIF